MYDAAIIGAGVIGTTIARELSKYELKVVVLEKSSDVSNGATKANSGIIHSGYDPELGTLMSKHNVLGNQMYDKLSFELDIPFKRIGSLLCALSDEDIFTIDKLYKRGIMAGVPELRVLGKEELLSIEPKISPSVLKALYAPTCGIIEPWEIAIAAMENAMDNGCELMLNFEVTNINVLKDKFEIYYNDQSLESKTIINASGIMADQISSLVGDDSYSITPRRGQYYLLDKSSRGIVNHVLFPCPTKLGKGVLVLPSVDGNVLIGPDSEELNNDLDSRIASNTTSSSLDYIKSSAKALINDIPYKDTITTFSGIRAESSTGDFVLGRTSIKGFYNVAGIKSPGLSAAPSIAKFISELVCEDLDPLEKQNFNPMRRRRLRLNHLSPDEINELVDKDSWFGRIVCRCEGITEGEIIDVINRNCGATTINGVKRRARPGAGRCQGGFCAPRVIEILANSLNLSPLDIRLEDKNSYILTGKTKGEI